MKGYEWDTAVLEAHEIAEHLNTMSAEGWMLFPPPVWAGMREGEHRFMVLMQRLIPRRASGDTKGGTGE